MFHSTTTAKPRAIIYTRADGTQVDREVNQFNPRLHAADDGAPEDALWFEYLFPEELHDGRQATSGLQLIGSRVIDKIDRVDHYSPHRTNGMHRKCKLRCQLVAQLRNGMKVCFGRTRTALIVAK